MDIRSDHGESDRPGASITRFRRPLALVAGIVVAMSVAGLLPSWWCGRDADRWFRGDPARVHGLAEELATGLFRQERSFLGFSTIHEYGNGYHGAGDIDSGPLILGISVSATGFALAPARSFGHHDVFTRLFRTADFAGLPLRSGTRLRFATGGVIGNALLLAFLTSGPELAR
jgi:hypothetical protein